MFNKKEIHSKIVLRRIAFKPSLNQQNCFRWLNISVNIFLCLIVRTEVTEVKLECYPYLKLIRMDQLQYSLIDIPLIIFYDIILL